MLPGPEIILLFVPLLLLQFQLIHPQYPANSPAAVRNQHRQLPENPEPVPVLHPFFLPDEQPDL